VFLEAKFGRDPARNFEKFYSSMKMLLGLQEVAVLSSVSQARRGEQRSRVANLCDERQIVSAERNNAVLYNEILMK
jgi:hypothetical protein